MKSEAPNIPKEDIQPEAPKKETSENVQYAGFWIRFVALIIDGIILGIVARIFFGSGSAGIEAGTMSVGYDGWQMIIPILYTILFWKYFAATPGKMALGLKIVQENGQNLEWKHALLRYVGYLVSGFVLCLGFIWAAFDKKKQGWHDKIAKTIVVK